MLRKCEMLLDIRNYFLYNKTDYAIRLAKA